MTPLHYPSLDLTLSLHVKMILAPRLRGPLTQSHFCLRPLVSATGRDVSGVNAHPTQDSGN